MQLGDPVEKKHGYRWPGVVVAVFHNIAGEERVVVECTARGVEGALRIYSPEQLRVTDEPDGVNILTVIMHR